MPRLGSRLAFADISRLTQIEDGAIAFAEDLHWGGAPTCHRCGAVDAVRLARRPGRYRCRACAQQFSICAGTPMEA